MTAPLKIAFLGSGAISAPVLRAAAAAPELEIVLAATQPDQPAGRKRQLRPTPFAEAAAALGIEVLRVADVNAPEFLDALRGSGAEMLLVVSFGQLLRERILALPRFGCVNLHASLLPRYRGASPIVQAILNRDPATGVAFMRMERGLDTGPVYRVFELPLDGTETASRLEDALGELAAVHLAGVLAEIAAGKLLPVPQNDAGATRCGKIRKSDGAVEWDRSAAEIEAMIRAYAPWPGAWSCWESPKGKGAATFRAARILAAPGARPGELFGTSRRQLVIGCGGDSALEILELQPAGGKPMSGAAFLNGLRGESLRFVTAPPETAEM